MSLIDEIMSGKLIPDGCYRYVCYCMDPMAMVSPIDDDIVVLFKAVRNQMRSDVSLGLDDH